MADWDLMPRIVAGDFTFVMNNARDFLRLYAREPLHAGLIVIVPQVAPARQRELFVRGRFPLPFMSDSRPSLASRRPRRLWFINCFFWPDHSATSQILSDLAFDLAEAGGAVSVITGRGLYDNASASLPERETHRGVTIHRVARAHFGRDRLSGRAIDYLSMYWSFAAALARLAARDDVVVVKTDPPLLSCAITPVARARGLMQINWLQDLYPEVALELGVRALKPVEPLLVALRDWSLKASARNVAIGELMARRLEARNVRSVSVIANWCDDESIAPVARETNPLRVEWGLNGKFVVGYSGNLGRAHEYDTVLSAAERLKDDAEIVFLFIGGGHQIQALKREAERRGLAQMFMFCSYQPAHALAKSLSAPDLHWVSLRPEMEGLIVPSKFVAAAAAGRATLAVSDPNGEVGALVPRYDCGLAVKPGDGEALANAIRALKADPDRLAGMGRNARAMLESQFARRRALDAWRGLLEMDIESRPVARAYDEERALAHADADPVDPGAAEPQGVARLD